MSAWSENATLFERLMEIHSDPPILYYGFSMYTLSSLLLLSLLLLTSNSGSSKGPKERSRGETSTRFSLPRLQEPATGALHHQRGARSGPGMGGRKAGPVPHAVPKDRGQLCSTSWRPGADSGRDGAREDHPGHLCSMLLQAGMAYVGRQSILHEVFMGGGEFPKM